MSQLQAQQAQQQQAQQEQTLVPPQQKSPVAIAIATFLRYHKLLKQRTGLNVINNEKQDFFRYKRCIRALLSDEYKKQQAKQPSLPPIMDNVQAQRVFILLIQNQLIQPANKLTTSEARSHKVKLEKGTPCLEPSKKATLQPDEYYIWHFTPPNPYLIIYSILGLIAVFTIVLFPLWPFWMRKGVWYLSTGLLGLIGLFFVVAIIRLIIYLFTLVFFTNRFWLFPNLFEDCGFIESFIPFYAWEEPSTGDKGSKKGKKSGNKKKDLSLSSSSSSKKAEDASSNGKTTQASTSNTQATQRVATIEEIED